MKRCIIFSYGPIPTPEQDKVEGGGLRCWGLAKGLRTQDNNMEITVAYHESYKKADFVSEFESINVTTWSEGSIEGLIADYDSVIVSYCMGNLSVNIAESIKPNQQLVLDCYVPIYVEISARDSSDIEGEYAAFKVEVDRWALVLRRGDVYLCANENQRRYYQGVLSALGRINPATYEDDLILIVPYGIYRDKPVAKSKPISKLLQTESKQFKKILWFGAVYPWFDLRTLVDAAKKINQTTPVKLVIVGAKNPFNAHPDFIKRYDELIEYVSSSQENKANVIFEDWVEFNSRADWYLDSDLVILINKIGNENQLAWRTRLVDYVWADLPILTNGGDPLGEELISAGAAARLDDLSSDGLAKSIAMLLAKPSRLTALGTALVTVRKNYYWDVVTKPLYDKIKSHARPTDFIKFGVIEVEGAGLLGRTLPGRVINKAKKVPAYYAKYGARNTYAALKTVVTKKARQGRPRRESRVVFVAHQLDVTGAPHVFVEVVKDFRKAHPKIPIEFHTFNPADKDNITALNSLGVKPKLHVSRDISLPYVNGDVLVLNTVAFSDTMRQSIYDNLEKSVIKKLIWYVHEDEPAYIFNKIETARITRLMKKGRITIFAAAQKTRDNYRQHFGVDAQIKTQIYRVNTPKKYHKIRTENDFNRLDFILPGMVGDGRKGQLPMLYAFIEFKQRYFDKLPDKYRDFSLTYIGVGQDFLSRQILKHVDEGLGKRFRYHGKISHDACLDYVLDANFTVCYSMRECLPMFVYEGMIAGHPLLRNDSSGLEEQLVADKNGYYLESENFEQVIETIEKACNKTKTTNNQLASMSRLSNSIAAKLEHQKYDLITESIATAYSKGGQ